MSEGTDIKQTQYVSGKTLKRKEKRNGGFFERPLRSRLQRRNDI